MKEIFASKERQDILDSYGIKYCFDQDLNFVFKNESDKKKSNKDFERMVSLVKILRRKLNAFFFFYCKSIDKVFTF